MATLCETIRRVPGARRAVHQVRAAYQRIAPLPVPRYLPNTPVAEGYPPDPATLERLALSRDAADRVLEVLDRLTENELLALQRLHLSPGPGGAPWRFANILTALWAASSLLRPRAYLEVGVQRGRSAAVVAAATPDVAIYGFDLWEGAYAGVSNPGPDFVRHELQAAGHVGDAVLVPGDSGATVPRVLRDRPDLFFDLITLDGIKTVRGVATDFANALPRLKVGGVLVFDDLPLFPRLRRVWQRNIEADPRFVSWEFTAGDVGVACAIRIG